MNSNKTYETPSLEVLNIETEQMMALSNVATGSGASAGGKIQQCGASDNQPSIWI